MPLNRADRIREELNTVLQEMKKALLALQQALTQEESNLSRGTEQKGLSVSFAKTFASKITSLKRLLLLYADGKDLKREEVLESLYVQSLSDPCAIAIQKSQDLIMLRLPYLPHRTSKDSLVLEALTIKLFKERNLPKWKACHIDFIHVYPTSTQMLPRDNDNYIYKKPIDLITFALGCSDHPLCCDYSATTVLTDEYSPGTYIGISPKSLENSVLRRWEN